MSHVPCYMNEDGTPACCTDSESRIAELEEENERLTAFCNEWVWGEENPREYETLAAKIATCENVVKIQAEQKRELEAELAALKAAAVRASAFVLPTGYDEDLALKMMTNAETYGFAFVADREYKRAEQAEAEVAALRKRALAQRCPVCNGSGRLNRMPDATSTAVDANMVTCHGCGGKGWLTV